MGSLYCTDRSQTGNLSILETNPGVFRLAKSAMDTHDLVICADNPVRKNVAAS